MVCFLRYQKWLFKVYDKGDDVQCLCFEGKKKVVERWRTKWDNDFKGSVYAVLNTTFKAVCNCNMDISVIHKIEGI